ncbi:MAG TPA: helix-turn-helix transcriptional regulator [Actinocrinis sp.]|nr:helix-turn-helix transcriptional regulator [Actinocrinis sp.]
MNPADGIVERFACELRALRAAAGELPFWKMARLCEVSKSALAGAVAGYELPSERVMRAFVRVCGGDGRWWSERLAQAHVQLEAVCDTAPAGDLPPRAVGSELVLVRHVLPALPAMTRGDIAKRPVFPLARPATVTGRRTRVGRPLVAVALAAAAALVAIALGVSALLHSRPTVIAATAAATPVPSGAYDQMVGPGCPHTALAKITQDDFTETHKWTQATATAWNVPGCSNLLLYSAPTASSDPDRWQDDYEWYFDDVPKTAQCTFHIYIPDSPDAGYAAAYDWTAGDSNYLDSTAFVIDQAAYRGQWYAQGPHVFSTGQAMMMITDARSNAPNATLAVAAIRLTCT